MNKKDADRFVEKTLLAQKKPKNLKEKLFYLIVGYRGYYWMYDGLSLKRLLEKVGFKGIKVLPPGETMIPNPGPLNLREREEESVDVEGVK